MQSALYRRYLGRIQLGGVAELGWHLGDVVRKLRELRDWKQDLLAEKAGVNISTVTRVEDGRETKSQTVIKIAAALGVSVAELYSLVPSGGMGKDSGAVAPEGFRDVDWIRVKGPTGEIVYEGPGRRKKSREPRPDGPDTTPN